MVWGIILAVILSMVCVLLYWYLQPETRTAGLRRRQKVVQRFQTVASKAKILM